ncbi:MAG: hypothetical protein ABI728_07610 [Betaproteobacteria bacterium]
MRDATLRRLDISFRAANAFRFSWKIRRFAAAGRRGDCLHSYRIEMAHGQDQGWAKRLRLC